MLMGVQIKNRHVSVIALYLYRTVPLYLYRDLRFCQAPGHALALPAYQVNKREPRVVVAPQEVEKKKITGH